jgi:hypothetical protein
MTFRSNTSTEQLSFFDAPPAGVRPMRRLPQARSFARLRALLAAIDDGLDDPVLIGRRMGAGPRFPQRHAAYYREAAEILGLVVEGGWRLTRAGHAVLGSEAESDDEREMLRAAIAGARDLGELAEAIIELGEPDAEALVQQAIAALSQYSRATSERRVRDTLSWRRYVHG